jgi:hypothetical protein
MIILLLQERELQVVTFGKDGRTRHGAKIFRAEGYQIVTKSRSHFLNTQDPPYINPE